MTTFELWYCQQLQGVPNKTRRYSYFSTYIYFEHNTFPWSIPYSNMLLKHMIVLPLDPDCSDLLMKTVCYQNVIMTGNSSLNGRKCSRKRLFNDFIQAYLINFCSLYIYKMDLFILLLLIMFICCLMAEVGMEARPEVGASPSLGFSLLFLFTLALTVLTKCTWSQLRYFLSIKKISILTANKFWFIFVFIWLYSMHWFLTESTIYLCPTPVNYKCCKSWD